MDPFTADILKFLAFGIVWLFPMALVIAVLGFSDADAKARENDLGPNVIQFPQPAEAAPRKETTFIDRIKRLAFPAQGR